MSLLGDDCTSSGREQGNVVYTSALSKPTTHQVPHIIGHKGKTKVDTQCR